VEEAQHRNVLRATAEGILFSGLRADEANGTERARQQHDRIVSGKKLLADSRKVAVRQQKNIVSSEKPQPLR
jgi:hypothetical protein